MAGARVMTLTRWLVFLCCFSAALPVIAAGSGTHRVYLARESADGTPTPQPVDVFSCDATIYAVAELENLPRGLHELLAVWSDPRGKARERTPLAFHARLANERVWVWLRLSRPSGAAAISFFDPAAGMIEFIGEWTVSVTLDGKKLETLRFKVLC